MRPDPIVEFCLGLGALAIALTVALLLAFPPAWLDRRQAASAQFANVAGLAEGANVTENGDIKGNVVSIETLRSGFRVHMRLRPDWHLKDGLGLTIEQINPLQAGSLMVARVCKRAPGDGLPAGCCPDALITGNAEVGETALASCGHTPGLIDKAMVITDMVSTQLQGMKNLTASVPAMLDTTKTAVTAITSMTNRVSGVLDDNRGSLKGIMANAEGTMQHVNGTTGTFDAMLTAKRDQLQNSIDNLTNVLATTAAAMPKIVADLNKTAEDMRAITGQVRNEPTSVIRVRERADPSFVEPAGK